MVSQDSQMTLSNNCTVLYCTHTCTHVPSLWMEIAADQLTLCFQVWGLHEQVEVILIFRDNSIPAWSKFKGTYKHTHTELS